MLINTGPKRKGNVRDNGIGALGKVLAHASAGYSWMGVCYFYSEAERKGQH